PLAGAIPLSPTLDTACAITLSVRDAVLLHEILAARRVALPGRPLRAARFAVPRTTMLDGLDNTVARAFERSLATLRAKGASIEELVLPELVELGSLQTRAAFTAAESFAWHRKYLAQHGAEYDPRVALRIRTGEFMQAADYIELHAARRAWIVRMQARLQGFDAMLSPTVPVVAPPLLPLLADDELFFRTNAALLRNPSVVNMLDGCALSLPCQQPDELPVGLMLWAGAHQDDRLLDLSLAVEAALAVTAPRRTA
ncbi:MAG TPA: amidase family protein, partial [Ideonella sp.]|nr:amidase family protein [Ideonella sp.]